MAQRFSNEEDVLIAKNRKIFYWDTNLANKHASDDIKRKLGITRTNVAVAARYANHILPQLRQAAKEGNYKDVYKYLRHSDFDNIVVTDGLSRELCEQLIRAAQKRIKDIEDEDSKKKLEEISKIDKEIARLTQLRSQLNQ